MWALLSRRLWMWVFFAIGAPLLGWLLGVIADKIERRNGPNQLTKLMGTGRDWLRGHTRGALAEHDRGKSRR